MTPHVSNRAFETLLRMRRVRPEKRPPSHASRIRYEIERICKAVGVPVNQVLGGTRKHKVCMARFIIAHNLRENGIGLDAIGKAINRHHTSVISALNQYDNLVFANDRVFMEMIGKL